MSWILKLFTKKQLIDLVWKIIKRVFKHLYDEIFQLCAYAQANMPDDSGYNRGRWVVAQFLDRHNELKEWAFVVEILKEIAHAELKKYTPANLSGIDVIKTKVLKVL